jgi:NAD(P)-dependent dehydrogenase (short-subunit alcohol dehydrogenase family)
MPKRVLITGTSTGFGRDTAERLARRGDHVFATMRDVSGRNAAHREALERLASQEGLRLRVLELDVTDQNSVDSAIAAALEEAGELDVVINNAGIAAIGVTEAFTPDQFEQIFAVNVYGVVRVNRAVLPSMRRQRTGLLVHVSSGAGRVTIPALAAYCASKYALEAIADAYRYELLPFGVDSIVVEPGVYRTGIHDRLLYPADAARLAEYGRTAEFAQRVEGVFQGIVGATDAPGSGEVVEALVALIDMAPEQRPFRTVVSAPIEQLLDAYNASADALRPIVAQIFNVPELAGSGVHEVPSARSM